MGGDGKAKGGKKKNEQAGFAGKWRAREWLTLSAKGLSAGRTGSRRNRPTSLVYGLAAGGKGGLPASNRRVGLESEYFLVVVWLAGRPTLSRPRLTLP